MSTYINLTQTFTDDMPTFPGDLKPSLIQFATIEKDGFTDHELRTGMHVGTHMDAAWHMIPSGKKISEMPIEKFFGRGVLIDARGKETIGVECLDGVNIETGDIVLVLTGFGSKFHEPIYFEKYPVLTEELAKKLVDLRVNIVGTDTTGPDYAPFKVHKIFLENDILILENLTNLEQLINKNFEVIALPMKLETDAAPARVVARIV